MQALFSLFILGLLIYPNVRLARKVGQNGVLWGFISVVLFFVFYMIFGGIFLFSIYKGPLTQPAINAFGMSHPYAILAILLFGVGGILLARFILERIGKSNQQQR